MSVTSAKVPIELLIDPRLPASAKVLWMALQLDARMDRAERLSPTRLSRRTGLSRPTVRRSLALLSQSQWGTTIGDAPLPGDRGDILRRSKRWVEVPAHLVTDGSIRLQARVLYGVLQWTPGFRHPRGKFTHASLAELVDRNTKTVARAIRELVEASWLEISQANRLAAIHFTLRNPVVAAAEKELAKVKRRLAKAQYRGEGIMREYLSLIVDSDAYEDDASPGFLENPLTEELLRLDRFYPPSVAFEFNGPQHYGPTERFSEEEATQQRVRDLIKAGLCVSRGIELVIIHPEDLSLETMRQRVAGLLPLRNLSNHWLVINFLESTSRSYRRAARRFTRPQRDP